MAAVSTLGAVSVHSGSTKQGPVAGVITQLQSFCKIEDVSILTQNCIMATPSHWYAGPAILKLYHSHVQPIIGLAQSFVTIEGNPMVQPADNSVSDFTAVVNSVQSFVTIEG